LISQKLLLKNQRGVMLWTDFARVIIEHSVAVALRSQSATLLLGGTTLGRASTFSWDSIMASEQTESTDLAEPAVNSSGGGVDFVPTTLRIGIAIAVAALLGWVVNTSVGAPYSTPTELLGVDMYSPAAMQQALAESEVEGYWKNGVIYFVILGVSLGIAPLLMIVGSGSGNPWLAASTGIVAGGVFGAMAFFSGSALRNWLDTGVELPLLGHAGESVSGDILVFVLAGVLISLPILAGVLLLGLPGAPQRAISVPLAAIVAGLLFPIAASFLMPEKNTKEFPPVGSSMLGLWLALLAALIILFMTTTGDKQRGKSSPDEVQPVA